MLTFSKRNTLLKILSSLNIAKECYIKINIKQNMLLKYDLKKCLSARISISCIHQDFSYLFLLISLVQEELFFFKILDNVSFPLRFTFPWLFCLFDYVASVLSIENPDHWFLGYNIKYIAIVYSCITLSYLCG